MAEQPKYMEQEVLQIIREEFRKKSEKVLKKGLREIDKVFTEWEAGFDEHSRQVPVQAANEKGNAVSYAPLNEKALHDIIALLDEFEGFPLAGFMEKMLQDLDFNLSLDPPAPVPSIIRTLDSDFWKKKPGDSFRQRRQKRNRRMSHAWARFFRASSIKSEHPWGVQEFTPRLLAQYYLATPVAVKIFELFEKRLREQALQFNRLHSIKEKDWRSVIMAVSLKFNGEGKDITQAERKKVADTAVPKEEKILTPLSTYSTELQELISERTTILLEKGIIAGTRLLPETSFGKAENKRALELFQKEYETSDNGFKKYFLAESNDWIKDIEVIILQLQTIAITNNTRAQLQKKISDNISPLLDTLLRKVKSSFDRIRESENSPHLKEKILQESRQAIRDLRLKDLPALIDAFSRASFTKTLENFSRRISHEFDSLNDEFAIMQRIDLESIPPDISTRTINLKKIIDTEYMEPLTHSVDEFRQEADQYLSNILRTLNEIGHMIQVNLETAMEILGKDAPESSKKIDVGKVVSDGLDRIYGIIEKTRPETQAISGIWGKELETISSEYIRGVDALLDNENIINLLIRKARADARRKFIDLRHTVGEKTGVFLRKSWTMISFGLTGARTGYEQLSKVSGMAEMSESVKDFMNFLYTTRQRIAKLPFIYQRLYRFEALKDQSIFVGRTEEMKRLEVSFQLWREGNFGSVAVVGEKGAGRTSLINVAEAGILKQVKLSRIKMPKGIRDEEALLKLIASVIPDKKPASLEELEKTFNELSNPVAIVVEDLHNLFIRTVDGFDIIDRFMLLLSRTPSKVFWVVSCGKYLWNYFERLISINKYFYDVITLGDLSVETTREIILKRHRLSGYELGYVPGKQELADRRYKKLPDERSRQEYLDAVYFKHLNDLARGNISSALLLWQLSVDSIKPNKVLISHELNFDPGFVNFLPEDELFTLAALVEHEVLTVAEHAEIFHQNQQQSELILLGLKNKGMLYATSDGFQIHSILYKHILRVLGDRNMLK